MDITGVRALPLHTLTRSGPSFRHCVIRETVVVTDALGLVHLPKVLRRAREVLPRQFRRQFMRFIPDRLSGADPDACWRLTPVIPQAFLGALGFERTAVSTHALLFNGPRERLYTVAGRRTPDGP